MSKTRKDSGTPTSTSHAVVQKRLTETEVKSEAQLQVFSSDKLVTEAEERHEAILQLEQSATEVFELFRDLNTLVTEQGDAIDRINKNVENTKKHVEPAHEDLLKAEKHQKACRLCVIL